MDTNYNKIGNVGKSQTGLSGISNSEIHSRSRKSNSEFRSLSRKSNSENRSLSRISNLEIRSLSRISNSNEIYYKMCKSV